MQINKYTDIVGVIASEDIAEGRMVLMTSHSFNKNYGSDTDLPGVKLPDTADEAARAQYILTWPVSNANAHGPIRLFIPQPSINWSLREGGFDKAANVPFSANVHLTYPGHKDGVTIPSGYQALAFAEGVFTVPSGAWEYSANSEVPGAPLRVMDTASDTAADAGKLADNTGGGGTTVARVERYDSDTGDLTFRTLNQ
jgi:hypothetical protein